MQTKVNFHSSSIDVSDKGASQINTTLPDTKFNSGMFVTGSVQHQITPRKDRNAALGSTINNLMAASTSTETMGGRNKFNKQTPRKSNVIGAAIATVESSITRQTTTLQGRRISRTIMPPPNKSAILEQHGQYKHGSGLGNGKQNRASPDIQGSVSKISILADKLDKIKMYNMEARKIQKQERTDYQQQIMDMYEPIFENDITKLRGVP